MVVGILGVVAAVGGAIWAYGPSADSAESTREQTDVAKAEASRLPNLKVARALAYLKNDLSGTENDGHTATKKVDGLAGPHVDITFENRANGPALITKAILKFREMGTVDTCGGTGGELAISVNYDFPVPYPLPKVPYVAEKDISFQVGTNELDRLTLTAGPDSVGGRPWYGVADVILEHDGGQKETVGTFALIDTGSDEHFFPNGDDWVIDTTDGECLAANAALVDHLLGIPNVIAAKELKSLDKSLTKLGY